MYSYYVKPQRKKKYWMSGGSYSIQQVLGRTEWSSCMQCRWKGNLVHIRNRDGRHNFCYAALMCWDLITLGLFFQDSTIWEQEHNCLTWGQASALASTGYGQRGRVPGSTRPCVWRLPQEGESLRVKHSVMC